MNCVEHIAQVARKLKVVMTGWLLLPLSVLAEEKAVVNVPKAMPYSTSEQMVKMVLGLLFVLVLIFLLAWLFKKYLGVAVTSNAALKPVAGVAVGQKERVVLLQVGERQVLVGVAPGQVNMLYALEKGEEVAIAKETGAGSFSEKLKSSLAGLEKK